MRITLAPLRLPPQPKPRRSNPRETAPPRPIKRARAAIPIPQPKIEEPRKALAPPPEAPRLEAAPTTPIASIPRPDEARPPLPSPPRPAVRAAPVFEHARAALTPQEPKVESSGQPMFSSMKTQGTRLKLPSGGASTTGFGAARAESPRAKAAPGTIATSGFSHVSAQQAGRGALSAETTQAGFAAAAVRREAAVPEQAAPAKQEEFVPVRILAKPEPVYTAEARALRLEGDVAVEALFTADGRIEEIRVVRGLGHGLDEAAVAAVQAIEFEPARRAGSPENARLRLTVRFQIAY